MQQKFTGNLRVGYIMRSSGDRSCVTHGTTPNGIGFKGNETKRIVNKIIYKRELSEETSKSFQRSPDDGAELRKILLSRLLKRIPV